MRDSTRICSLWSLILYYGCVVAFAVAVVGAPPCAATRGGNVRGKSWSRHDTDPLYSASLAPTEQPNMARIAVEMLENCLKSCYLHVGGGSWSHDPDPLYSATQAPTEQPARSVAGESWSHDTDPLYSATQAPTEQPNMDRSAVEMLENCVKSCYLHVGGESGSLGYDTDPLYSIKAPAEQPDMARSAVELADNCVNFCYLRAGDSELDDHDALSKLVHNCSTVIYNVRFTADGRFAPYPTKDVRTLNKLRSETVKRVLLGVIVDEPQADSLSYLRSEQLHQSMAESIVRRARRERMDGVVLHLSGVGYIQSQLESMITRLAKQLNRPNRSYPSAKRMSLTVSTQLDPRVRSEYLRLFDIIYHLVDEQPASDTRPTVMLRCPNPVVATNSMEWLPMEALEYQLGTIEQYNPAAANTSSEPSARQKVTEPMSLATCWETCGLEYTQKARPNNRVIGGHPLIHGRQRWLAKVEIVTPCGKSVSCTGALISPSHVVTAAHCVYYDENTCNPQVPNGTVYQPALVSELSVITQPNFAQSQRNAVSAIGYVAPTYNPRSPSAVGDLVVLELIRPLVLGPSVGIICLPQMGVQDYPAGEQLRFGGTGRFNKEGQPPLQPAGMFIREGLLSQASSAECIALAGAGNTDLVTCFGGNEETTCSGDSGGPVFKQQNGRSMLIGITSRGDCSDTTVNGGDIANPISQFARVSAFCQFIEAHTTPRGGGAPAVSCPTSAYEDVDCTAQFKNHADGRK